MSYQLKSAKQSLSISNVMRSITLAVAALCASLACLALFVGLLAPFWYRVTTVITYKYAGPVSSSENMGMTGYVDYNGRWHNLNFLEKSFNRIEADVNAQESQKKAAVPNVFKAAQVLYISAFMVAACSTAGLLILAMKPFRYFVAELSVAASLFYCVVAFIISIILSIVAIDTEPRYIWPERPYKIVSLEWAAYLGIIGTVLIVVAFVAMVFGSVRSCRHVEQARKKPKQNLEDEPLYYKFDYRLIPKVRVKPNPILGHVYTNPVMRSVSPPPAVYITHPPPGTPSAASAYSYSIDDSRAPQPHPYVVRQPHISYGDSDMDTPGYTVSVNDQGQRMVSM